MTVGGLSQAAAVYRTILAGAEAVVPVDSPSRRLDSLGTASLFNAVGALEIRSRGLGYKGSAIALSGHWVLTAGHNLDLDDDGAPDPGLEIRLHLAGFGVYAATGFHTYPDFTGFGNPSVQHDLGLLHFDETLPDGVVFPAWSELHVGDTVALVGYGRSGYGDYGYTTEASLTDRRVGYNVVDGIGAGDLGGGFDAVFRYDFDAPETAGLAGGSVGNDRESIIGPGDSGGPVLVQTEAGWAIAGISTFTEGYGGRFGDIGGGVVIGPYLDWIAQTTGLPVPEPGVQWLLLAGWAVLAALRGRRT